MSSGPTINSASSIPSVRGVVPSRSSIHARRSRAYQRAAIASLIGWVRKRGSSRSSTEAMSSMSEASSPFIPESAAAPEGDQIEIERLIDTERVEIRRDDPCRAPRPLGVGIRDEDACERQQLAAEGDAPVEQDVIGWASRPADPLDHDCDRVRTDRLDRIERVFRDLRMRAPHQVHQQLEHLR